MSKKKLESQENANQREDKPTKDEQKVGPGKPPVEYRFKPGNPGRPKGSRNKLGEAFVADLYAHWQKHGHKAIEKVAKKRPHDYLKVIASILPKDLNVRVGAFDELSDDDLVKRIRQLDAHVRPFLDLQAEPARLEPDRQADQPAIRIDGPDNQDDEA